MKKPNKSPIAAGNVAEYRKHICAHVFSQLKRKGRHPAPTLTEYLYSLTGKADPSSLSNNDWNLAMSKLGELNRLSAKDTYQLDERSVEEFYEVFGEAVLGRKIAQKDLADLTDDEREKLTKTIAGVSGDYSE